MGYDIVDYDISSELDVVVVGQLQFLADVLPPGGVQSHQLREEVSSHHALGETGSVEGLLVVVALHSPTRPLHILAVVHQHSVDLSVVVRDDLPVVDHSRPVEHCSQGDHLGERVHPPVSLPSDIAQGVLDQSEEILESSSFVSPVSRFLAQSELLEFPVILLAHGPIISDQLTCRSIQVVRWHWGPDRTCSRIRGFCIDLCLPDLETLLNWGITDPEIVCLHLLVDRHNL